MKLAMLAPFLALALAQPLMAQCTADLNRDGKVDGSDLAVLLARWGNCASDSSPPPAAGPVIWGSRRPSQMIADLAAGADSLDIVLIGDSNTGSALAGMWGYHAGLSQSMNDRGWPCYGLPIYPAMTEWNNGPAYALGGWNATAFIFVPTGALNSGRVRGRNTPYSAWSPGSTWVRYGAAQDSPAATDDWAYVESGTYRDSFNGVWLPGASPLNSPRSPCGTVCAGEGSVRAAVHSPGRR